MDYDDEDYEEEQQEIGNEEDIQTQIGIYYFEVQDKLRTNKIEEALTLLNQLYQLSDTNNLKNWKTKILNNLLQIHALNQSFPNISLIFNKIIKINQTDKYNENSMKSVLMVVKSMKKQIFSVCKTEIMHFVINLLQPIKLKALLMLLQKHLQQKNVDQVSQLFKMIQDISQQKAETLQSCVLHIYSLQITYYKMIGKSLTDQIEKMKDQMPLLQTYAFVGQRHLFVLKEAIAVHYFIQNNFQDCSLYLNSCFVANIKSDTVQVKNHLKINALICLLIQNQQLKKNQKYNLLYHEASNPFKTLKQIQILYLITKAFQQSDYSSFVNLWNLADIHQANFLNLKQKILLKITKSKLYSIIKCYKSIKIISLTSRLKIDSKQIIKAIEQLIYENKIQAKINLNHQFIQIKQQINILHQNRKQNLKELSKKYLPYLETVKLKQK